MNGIAGFMHVATIGPWREIVRSQLTKAKKIGLWDVTKTIYVGVVGPDEFDIVDAKIQVLYHGDLGLGENQTINRIKDFCSAQDDLYKVWYVHTKGVSRLITQPTSWPYKHDCVVLWRKYLEYFILTRYQDCIRALDKYVACGVELDGCLFLGNFWWARSSYIKDQPYIPLPKKETFWEDRKWAERFLCREGRPAFLSFNQSGRNLYLEPYYPTQYIRCKLML